MQKKHFIFCLISFLFTLNVAAQTPSWEWVKSAGDSLLDVGYSVATDASGNCYVAGGFSSDTIIFGNTQLYNLANNMLGNFMDMFLVKYDPNGNVLWAKSAGGIQPDVAYSVTVDVNGGVLVVGYFNDLTITFGSTTLSNADIFIVKYDASGNVLWAKSPTGYSGGTATSVSTDAQGNCYVGGKFTTPTLTFGSTTLTNSGNSTTDAFLAKYDSNGNVLWAVSGGGVDDESIDAVVTDLAGNTYAAGKYFSGAIAFGSTTLNNTSFNFCDLFLVKYDASGNLLWAKKAGGLYNDQATSVCLDGAGNCYLAGNFASSTLTIGSSTLTNAGSDDALLAKYDSNGNVLWAKAVGGSASDGANSVAVHGSGNVYVTGFFSSSPLTFGPSTVTNTGLLSDILLLQFDPLGNPLWAKSAKGIDRDAAQAVTVDASGNVFVTGYFESATCAFSSDTLFNAASGGKDGDFFIGKIGKGVEGIFSETADNNTSIFPNPSSGIFHFEMNGEKNLPAEIEIYNAFGQLILQTETQNSEVNIDLSEKAKGIYFYRVSNEAGILGTGKMVLE